MAALHDKFGRAITDLRISITDRCNYKCVYCRTGNEGALYGDLPFADYLRMARVLVGMGITKIRLTGGEPLLRGGVVEFVRELSKLRPQGLKPFSLAGANGTAEAVPLPKTLAAEAAALHEGAGGEGAPLRQTVTVETFRQSAGPPSSKTAEGDPDNFFDPLDIALTTNGHLLADLARPLKDAGLTRVTVSMDAVDPERFARITRVPNGFEQVLAGVRAAQRAGLHPVKVNCVLLRGFNDDQIPAFGRFARDEGVVVRFIEFMPLEEDRVWSPEIVVTLDEILRRMAEFMPLREVAHANSETARRYVFEDGTGEIGIIAPVSHPFCGHCSRVRVTSDGKIRTCLFSVREHDLAALMAAGGSDDEMAEFIRGVVDQK